MNNCGTCTNYVAMHGLPRGYCHLNPPTPFESGVCRRPEVKEKEPGCAHHAPRPEGQPPAVKEKTNADTPGTAAKAARQARK